MTDSSALAPQSKYTRRLWSEICERLSDGESMRSICEDGAMPSRKTVENWLRRCNRVDPDGVNLRQYARARAMQAAHYAEEIVTIADECPEDRDSIAKAKQRIDARKWYAGKLAPKVFGPLTPNVNIDARDQSQHLTIHAREAAGQALERIADPQKRAALQQNLEMIYEDDDAVGPEAMEPSQANGHEKNGNGQA